MALVETCLKRYAPQLAMEKVQLSIIGDRARLSHQLRQTCDWAEALTGGAAGQQPSPLLHLTIALSYGSRADITAAARHLAEQVAAGSLQPHQISEALLSQQLASWPVVDAVGPPDLLLRTSGCQRLSNFMLWEAAYAELMFVDVLWPDFSPQHFGDCVREFSRRKRTFGRRDT